MNNCHNIELLGTAICHLCENAESLLKDFCLRYPYQYQKIDIVDDEELYQQYKLTIPVIRFKGNEIGWPFSIAEIETFILEK